MSDDVKPVDWTKPIQTRNGRKARVLCTDLVSPGRPVAVAIVGSDGDEFATSVSVNGQYFIGDTCANDIINVPPPPPVTLVLWVNVYPDGAIGDCFRSREDADDEAGTARIACKRIEITYRPGEYDEEPKA